MEKIRALFKAGLFLLLLPAVALWWLTFYLVLIVVRTIEKN